MAEDDKLILADVDPDAGFWVFAYGSLMWRPGFVSERHTLATLHGYHRSFCMASIVYRGTPEAPGLVLALDEAEGHHCTGVGYRVSGHSGAEILDYLRERELVSAAYREVIAPIRLETGEDVPALTYVVDRDHHQYRGNHTAHETAEIIASAHGPAGSNREYLQNTVKSLRRLGLDDPDLFDIARRVQSLG